MHASCVLSRWSALHIIFSAIDFVAVALRKLYRYVKRKIPITIGPYAEKFSA